MAHAHEGKSQISEDGPTNGTMCTFLHGGAPFCGRLKDAGIYFSASALGGTP